MAPSLGKGGRGTAQRAPAQKGKVMWPSFGATPVHNCCGCTEYPQRIDALQAPGLDPADIGFPELGQKDSAGLPWVGDQ